MTGTVEPIRDHWWWRPGWRVGRSFYTWHITFAGQEELTQLAETYAPIVQRLDLFDVIPPQWLHCTMQGVGFTDEVDRNDIDAMVQAARQHLVQISPCTVTIGPPYVDPETVQMEVQPLEPLRRVRAAVRLAIADVWGRDRVPEPETWRPHVSLAYANGAGPSEPAVAALAKAPSRTATVEVRSVSLIDLNRDEKRYVWREIAEVLVGGSEPTSPWSGCVGG